MSFHLPSDDGFEQARRIRRGEARPDPVFDDFVAAFTRAFGIVPLTLSLDTLAGTRTRGPRPRLGVVVERTAERRTFFDAAGLNYDPELQSQIARLFADTVPRRGLAGRFGLPLWHRRADWAEDLFVYVAEFEQTAEWAAHAEVTGEELTSFVAELDLGERFWCTERLAGPPIVFVHTDARAEALRATDAPDRWADLYFPLVHRHDEFDYLSRSEISIRVDSKETFDRYYASNWGHYFR